MKYCTQIKQDLPEKLIIRLIQQLIIITHYKLVKMNGKRIEQQRIELNCKQQQSQLQQQQNHPRTKAQSEKYIQNKNKQKQKHEHKQKKESITFRKESNIYIKLLNRENKQIQLKFKRIAQQYWFINQLYIGSEWNLILQSIQSTYTKQIIFCQTHGGSSILNDLASIKFYQLKVLNLQKNQIQSIQSLPWIDSPHLDLLSLKNNSITNLSSFKKLNYLHLKHFNIQNNIFPLISIERFNTSDQTLCLSLLNVLCDKIPQNINFTSKLKNSKPNNFIYFFLNHYIDKGFSSYHFDIKNIFQCKAARTLQRYFN